MSFDEANRCVICNVDLGECNPRQYCMKTYCPMEDEMLRIKENKEKQIHTISQKWKQLSNDDNNAKKDIQTLLDFIADNK